MDDRQFIKSLEVSIEKDVYEGLMYYFEGNKDKLLEFIHEMKLSSRIFDDQFIVGGSLSELKRLEVKLQHVLKEKKRKGSNKRNAMLSNISGGNDNEGGNKKSKNIKSSDGNNQSKSKSFTDDNSYHSFREDDEVSDDKNESKSVAGNNKDDDGGGKTEIYRSENSLTSLKSFQLGSAGSYDGKSLGKDKDVSDKKLSGPGLRSFGLKANDGRNQESQYKDDYSLKSTRVSIDRTHHSIDVINVAMLNLVHPLESLKLRGENSPTEKDQPGVHGKYGGNLEDKKDSSSTRHGDDFEINSNNEASSSSKTEEETLSFEATFNLDVESNCLFQFYHKELIGLATETSSSYFDKTLNVKYTSESAGEEIEKKIKELKKKIIKRDLYLDEKVDHLVLDDCLKWNNKFSNIEFDVKNNLCVIYGTNSVDVEKTRDWIRNILANNSIENSPPNEKKKSSDFNSMPCSIPHEVCKVKYIEAFPLYSHGLQTLMNDVSVEVSDKKNMLNVYCTQKINKNDLKKKVEDIERQIKTEMIEISKKFDLTAFEDKVLKENKYDDVVLKFDEDKRKCLIFGTNKNVKKTKKWIENIYNSMKEECKKDSKFVISKQRERSKSNVQCTIGTNSFTIELVKSKASGEDLVIVHFLPEISLREISKFNSYLKMSDLPQFDKFKDYRMTNFNKDTYILCCNKIDKSRLKEEGTLQDLYRTAVEAALNKSKGEPIAMTLTLIDEVGLEASVSSLLEALVSLDSSDKKKKQQTIKVFADFGKYLEVEKYFDKFIKNKK